MKGMLAAAPYVLLLCAPAAADARSRLAFEVVSIKLAPFTPGNLDPVGYRIDGGRVQILGYPLAAIMMRAFRVSPRQVDMRNFAGDEYYDIEATLPAGASAEQVPEMLQTMLSERFELAYHREIRESKTAVLTVGKSGMKLPRQPDDTKVSNTASVLADGTLRRTLTGNVASLSRVMSGGATNGALRIVDQTGLDGIYTWVLDVLQPPSGTSYQDALQEAFKAMIETAGLKMETRKAATETIVVDHLERKPTEN